MYYNFYEYQEAKNVDQIDKKAEKEFMRLITLSSRKCFKSLPDDVVLDMATREFEMEDSQQCVCGWAFRAGMEKLKDSEFSGLFSRWIEGSGFEEDTMDGCFHLYNQANEYEWGLLYKAVTDNDLLPLIELEFVNRVVQAVNNAEND